MTYKDHYQQVGGQGGNAVVCTHSWADFTAKRLAWLYGDQDRTAAQSADLAGWNSLGLKQEAA